MKDRSHAVTMLYLNNKASCIEDPHHVGAGYLRSVTLIYLYRLGNRLFELDRSVI